MGAVGFWVFLSNAAWAAAVVWIVYWFRDPLIELLGRLARRREAD